MLAAHSKKLPIRGELQAGEKKEVRPHLADTRSRGAYLALASSIRFPQSLRFRSADIEAVPHPS
jgi:hypothetical protein